MLATSADPKDLDSLASVILAKWADSTRHDGPVVDFVGMTFDFNARRDAKQVEVTQHGMTDAIVAESGVTRSKSTPATLELFEVDEASPPLDAPGAKAFRSAVAKVLWVGKRTRPEVLAAVGFLSTRVTRATEQDAGKLQRVHQYLYGSGRRGIALGVGEEGVGVRAHIDAAYGVHSGTGRSHSGCSISLGKGPVYVASKGQKIVTKSSTEAELVALSDMASQAIHVRGFVSEQGHAVGPAVIYQDNLSCMALMKKGGPCSERSRHISIRRFWVKERADLNEVSVEHLSTTKMHANVLTKSVVGEQFVTERQGLTNWELGSR
jgi:hypothetical protein